MLCNSLKLTLYLKITIVFSVLKVQTELIVTAHECFTISSNMEGISHVLRAARLCSESLAAAGEFNLMVSFL